MLAFVLLRRDFREYDQIISLYTREFGKLEVIAKGIKKITSRNSGNLEVLALLEIVVEKGKEINHLTKVRTVKVFSEIASDLGKLVIVKYILKIVDDFTLPQEKDEKIFNLVLSLMEFLNSAKEINSLNLADAFIFKLWHCFGFGIDEKKLRMWFEEEWSVINDLELSSSERKKIDNEAINFAQYHSGKKIAIFREL